MIEPSPFRPGNPEKPSLRYLFLRFLRIGFLAWGGPVAQIGLMHRELVERDTWIDETRFKKVLALYQALPGPEAHELAVYFGAIKRGRPGAMMAGLGFMLPGVTLVTLLAVLYTFTAETTRIGQFLLYGARPAVLALIAWGFLKLAKRSLTTPTLILIGAASALAAYLFPAIGFLTLLLAGGLVALGLAPATKRIKPLTRAMAILPFGLAIAVPAFALTGLAAVALLGLKAGLLSFGGAYTAVPFLQQGAVEEYGWITNDQFLDAFALSGLMPAPLISVGVFVGYLAAGFFGALVITITMFAPAFGFTLIGHHHFERIVNAPRLHELLLGVTAAVIGLILVASVPLARAAFPDLWTILLGATSLAALLTQRVPIPVTLLGSSLLGVMIQSL